MNPMIFKHLQSGIAVEDDDFDNIYTKRIKAVSEFHFTPVEVAKTAAQFLAEKSGAKVLDIGSGAGKFCMIGAVCTKGHFTGVEQRESLYLLSEQLVERFGLSDIDFIHSNITEIDFKAFDSVYFFNAFQENIFRSGSIDDSVLLDKQLYTMYSAYVKNQLDTMPAGTRLATYFSFMDEVPDSYKIQFTHFDDKLKLWQKIV